MSEANKYRKKPVVIQAIEVCPTNLDEVRDFLGGEERRNIDFGINYANHTVTINTLEGTMKASTGDWIIRGVKGEYYPCKPEIFQATYEPAAELEEKRAVTEAETAKLREALRAIRDDDYPEEYVARANEDESARMFARDALAASAQEAGQL